MAHVVLPAGPWQDVRPVRETIHDTALRQHSRVVTHTKSCSSMRAARWLDLWLVLQQAGPLEVFLDRGQAIDRVA